MQKLIICLALFSVAISEIGGDATSKVVCMYDSRSFIREGMLLIFKKKIFYYYFFNNLISEKIYLTYKAQRGKST